jgi:hypothetical protein
MDKSSWTAEPRRRARPSCITFAPVLIAIGVFIGSSEALAADDKPVFVGGEADLDACGSSGIVTGLKPAGDNFLAVRSGPAVESAMLLRVRADQQLIICDRGRDDRGDEWLGVVVPVEGRDCGVGSPIAERRRYDGPCRSGWVHGKYVRIVAG